MNGNQIEEKKIFSRFEITKLKQQTISRAGESETTNELIASMDSLDGDFRCFLNVVDMSPPSNIEVDPNCDTTRVNKSIPMSKPPILPPLKSKLPLAHHSESIIDANPINADENKNQDTTAIFSVEMFDRFPHQTNSIPTSDSEETNWQNQLLVSPSQTTVMLTTHTRHTSNDNASEHSNIETGPQDEYFQLTYSDNTQLISPTMQSINTFYSHEELAAPGPYPPGICVHKREIYLAEEDFKRILGVRRSEWESLPKWKQVRRKREMGLF